MATITVPGEQHRAASIILDGRAASVGLSKDTRGWIERGRDSLARRCPGCLVNPINVVRVSLTLSCAWCDCGTVVKMDLNSEPARVESEQERKNAAAFRAELKDLAKRSRR